MDALRQIEGWPVEWATAGVTTADRVLAVHGDAERVQGWASVTKPVTALAALVAVEEGIVDLEEPAGPPGSTIRHLLAHASGLGPEPGPPLIEPERRRVYSNYGFEVLADVIAERSEMPFAEYLRQAALDPLGLSAELVGSAGSGLEGPLRDVLAIGREYLAPRAVAPETLDEATTVQFPGLIGVLPSFGRMDPNDWGLGVEIRDGKAPHWTGATNSPRTFGHFGATGTFLWVDPDAGLACAALTDRPFGDWAKEAWPRLSDAVLASAQSSA